MNASTATRKRSRRVSTLDTENSSFEELQHHCPSVIIAKQQPIIEDKHPNNNHKRLKLATAENTSPLQSAASTAPSQCSHSPASTLPRRVSDLSSLYIAIDESSSDDSSVVAEIKPPATTQQPQGPSIITPSSSSSILRIDASDTETDAINPSLPAEPCIGLSLENDEVSVNKQSSTINNMETTSVLESDDARAYKSTASSSRTGWWKFFVEMLLIQWFVWLAATIHYQTSNQLYLPSTVRDSNSTALEPAQSTALQMASYDDDCIYVPGGGFSGFWFSLGRLQSVSAKEVQQETFVCYSAGCLGVVATLLQHFQTEMDVLKGNTAATLKSSPTGHEHLYDMARSIQVDWLEGRIHRYEIVENFIDGILESLAALRNDDDPAVQALYKRFFGILQNNLHITTTVPTDAAHAHRPLGASLQAAVRSPTDEASLKQMLLQTTWIPIAVGSSFAHDGHLDGAFSTLQHPSCRRHVGLVVPKKQDGTYFELIAGTIKLFGNALNVNLGKQAVEDLWQMGLDYGV